MKSFYRLFWRKREKRGLPLPSMSNLLQLEVGHVLGLQRLRSITKTVSMRAITRAITCIGAAIITLSAGDSKLIITIRTITIVIVHLPFTNLTARRTLVITIISRVTILSISCNNQKGKDEKEEGEGGFHLSSEGQTKRVGLSSCQGGTNKKGK